MKAKEKLLAKKLRAKGWPINKIYRKLGVSKGTVSVWVRNIALTHAQKEKIHRGRFCREVIEKTRLTRLRHENARRQVIIDKAKTNIADLSINELFLISIALYWGEGGKTGGVVRISNGDPRIIQIMMRFFRDICHVPEEKFRGYLHIHPHLDYKNAEKHWSKIAGIPLRQFYKTYRIVSKASKQKKDSLPYGTFEIYVNNKELLLKLQGWTEKIYELASPMNNMVQNSHAAVAQW